MSEEQKELTPEEQAKIDELKKAKKEQVLLSPRKLILEPGDSALLEFIKKMEVKATTEAGKDRKFFTFIFKDAIFNDTVYLTGSGLAKVDWIKGSIYEITYNGMSDTQSGQRFKSFDVNLLKITK